MIALRCTNCRQTLEIDDAFAGGVCRCSHCGAIQTVPRAGVASRGGSAQGSPVAPADDRQTPAARAPVAYQGTERRATDGKTLYARGAGSGGPGSGGAGGSGSGGSGSGLDELGEIVTSSGLGGSGLEHARRTGRKSGRGGPGKSAKSSRAGRGRPAAGGSADSSSPPATAGPTTRRTVVITAIAAGAVAVLAAGAFLLVPRGTPARGGVGREGTASDQAESPAAPAGPSFAGVPLAGDSVIYLIDRGQASRETFGYAGRLVVDSAASLGPTRRFQVVFWDGAGTATPGEHDAPDRLRPADAGAVDLARRRFAEISASGQTEVGPALARAVAQGPAELVIATAKGWQLDDAFAAQVVGAVAGTPIRVHAFALGGGDSVGLRGAAERTGGTFAELDLDRLRALAP